MKIKKIIYECEYCGFEGDLSTVLDHELTHACGGKGLTRKEFMTWFGMKANIDLLVFENRDSDYTDSEEYKEAIKKVSDYEAEHGITKEDTTILIKMLSGVSL